MNLNENEEDTKYCFNCRRNIPVGNHVMHTAYCHRNLKLCLKCDEPFLTSEYEDHLKTMHAHISCDACFEKLEAIDLESHKLTTCPHRLQTCNYCDIDVEVSSLPSHTDMCSSRTERCNDCGQFVMLKYVALHKENHLLNKISKAAKPLLDDSPESLAAFPPLTKKVPNTALAGTSRTTTRTTSMPTLRLHDPIMTNHRVSPSAKRNNDQPQINTNNNNDHTHKDPKKNMPIVDTPSDDDEFSSLGAHSIPNNQSESFNNHVTNEYDYNDTLRGVQLPCEFCEKMIDSENLVLHETGCRPDLARFHNDLYSKNKNINSQNDKFPVPPSDLDSSSSDSDINLNTLSLSSDDDDNNDSDKTNIEKLPCEFCEELISIKQLINHQMRCEKVNSDFPVINNLDKEVTLHQPDKLHTKYPKSGIFESKRNLFLPTSAPANFSGSTLVLRNSDNTQYPTSSTYEPQMIQKLPRVKLNRPSPKRNVSTDNRYLNNSARNNYEQFLLNSRLNHSELASTRDNYHLHLNPSGGAIPKQKNVKSSNNRKVNNNLSKRKDSDSSSD